MITMLTSSTGFFKKDKDGTYESTATMNEYELEMSTYMQNILH